MIPLGLRKNICIGLSSPIFCLGGVDADGSGLIDYTEFLAATLDKYLSRSKNPDIFFFAAVPCCQLFGFKLQKKSWGTKKVPRSWIGKLRKCYLQEDVCYTAFSPKPQLLSSRVFVFFREKTSSSNETRCFWPGWWWTYHSRGSELHLQAGFDKSPGCGVTQTARSWRRSLRTAASTRPSERAAFGQLDTYVPAKSLHDTTSEYVRLSPMILNS